VHGDLLARVCAGQLTTLPSLAVSMATLLIGFRYEWTSILTALRGNGHQLAPSLRSAITALWQDEINLDDRCRYRRTDVPTFTFQL